MSDIFGNNKIIDINNSEKNVFSTYIMDGITYYITIDKKVFTKNGNSYKEVDVEIAKKVIITFFNKQENDIIEFEER